MTTCMHTLGIFSWCASSWSIVTRSKGKNNVMLLKMCFQLNPQGYTNLHKTRKYLVFHCSPIIGHSCFQQILLGGRNVFWILVCMSKNYRQLSMSRFEAVIPAAWSRWPAASPVGSQLWPDHGRPRPASRFSALCHGDNKLSSKTCRFDPYLSWWIFCLLLLFMDVLVFGLLTWINFKNLKRYQFIVFA